MENKEMKQRKETATEEKDIEWTCLHVASVLGRGSDETRFHKIKKSSAIA